MKEHDLEQRTFEFAKRIIRLFQVLQEKQEGRILGNQLLRSGTSIGANYQESQAAQSKNDFIAKVSISLKEARETLYWLKLIAESDILPQNMMENILGECEELTKILGSIVFRSKR